MVTFLVNFLKILDVFVQLSKHSQKFIQQFWNILFENFEENLKEFFIEI